MSISIVLDNKPDAGVVPAGPPGLAQWYHVVDGKLSIAAQDRLRAHPRFRDAVHHLMGDILTLSTIDPIQDRVRKDLGRYMAAMLAIYLNIAGDFTLPALKELCARTGMLSPGRARAVLLYLRVIGYVEPAGRVGNVQRYAATKPLVKAFRHHLAHGLAALALIEPEAAIVLAHFDRPGVFEAMVRRLAEGALDASPQLNTEESRMFAALVPHYGGMQVLYCFLEAVFEQDVPLEGGVVDLSVRKIAQRTGISRAQVVRLIDRIEREGFATREGASGLRLTHRFIDDMYRLVATNLIARAVAAIPALELIETA